MSNRENSRWSRYVASALNPEAQRSVRPETGRRETGNGEQNTEPNAERRATARSWRERARAGIGRAREAWENRETTSTDAPSPLRELRLLPVAATVWAAAFAVVRLPPSAGWALAGSAAVLAVLLVLAASRGQARDLRGGSTGPGTSRSTPHSGRRSGQVHTGAAAVLRGAAVPAAAAALVCAGATGSLAARTGGPISGLIAEEASITVELWAASDARPAAADQFTGKPRYLIDAVAESGTADGQRFGASATLLVVGGEDYAPIRLGDRFTSAGPLQPLPAGDRNLALLRAAAPPEVTPARGWYAATAGLRGDFVQAAEDRGADVEGLLPGMVLGDRGGLDSGLEQAMKNTGLTHLTAVSGANCSYLLAFIFLTARALRMPRVPAVLLALTGLTAFVLLVRPDPSVLRAAVMGGLGTLAVLSGRGRLPVALLFLSITVLLAIDPWLCTSYAFTLSVCATSGLVLLGPHLVRLLTIRLPLWFAAALAVPIAAQLFCAPVLVLLQPELPVYSVPANLVVAPVVPAVTITGMLAVAVVGVAPELAGIPLTAAAAGAWWVGGTARAFESFPGALAPWPAGGPGSLLMGAAMAGAVCLIVYLSRGGGHRPGLPRRRRQSPRPLRPRRRMGRWTVAGAAFALVLPAGTILAIRGAGEGPAGAATDWVLAACDVGQGDGLAIRAGPDSAVVVDAGPEPAAMDSCLDRLGVRSVELLVITHAHLDHYGGTAGVLSGRTVSEVGYSTAGSGLPPELQGALSGSSAPRRQLTEGMTGTAGTVHWEVLWPRETAGRMPGTAAAREDDENNASAVLLLSVASEDGQPLTILLTGDAETDASAAVLASHPILGSGVDVLKVPHHGARNGGGGWLDAVRPTLAVISVGADNDYGHPAPQIIEGLERSGTTIARTDELGTVLVERKEDSLHVGGLPNRRRYRAGSTGVGDS